MLHAFPIFDRNLVDHRRIGQFDRGLDGPIVIAVGGVHGNEPAGILGIRTVLDHLQKTQPDFKGKFFGLSGNLTALKTGERFIDHDLNRIWVEDDCNGDQRELGSEGHEMNALHEALQDILSQVSGPVLLLDLHTTSAEGCPFMMVDDSQDIGDYKAFYPVPIITGLIDCLHGTLVRFMVNRGHRALVFEGGQHDKITTVENVIAAIWILLVKLGCLERSHVPDYDFQVTRLAKEAAGLPEILDIFYRHVISAEDQYETVPGFFNFDPVQRGEILAHDQHGAIRASQDGRILMPRYQGQGNDGYFLGTESTVAHWTEKNR